MSPLVVPDSVASTSTTPMSIIITLAYSSTDMLHSVAATSSRVTESSARGNIGKWGGGVRGGEVQRITVSLGYALRLRDSSIGFSLMEYYLL